MYTYKKLEKEILKEAINSWRLFKLLLTNDINLYYCGDEY